MKHFSLRFFQKQFLPLLGLVLSLVLSFPASASGLDGLINNYFAPVAAQLSKVVFFSVPIFGAELPLIVLWLIVAGLFFTFYFRFLSFRGFSHALKITRGDFDDPTHPGEVSHFQGLATAVSGTVGIGNIGGVAIAISMGGPGATFWLIVAGLLGMSTKFVECTLGIFYRKYHSDGSVSGGPMYYLERGLAELGKARLGRALGIFYALGIVIGCLGIGNMFQSNQAYLQVVTISGGDSSWLADKGWLFGLVLASVVGLVIIGGIKSIARVTSKVVPFMVVLYCGGALVMLTMNYEAIPFAVNAIVSGAFSPDGVSGGLIGVMIIGFQRAAFSNEAGIGSAAIAHSAVKTKNALTEGYVAMLEPFIDTVVICSFTALVVVTTLYYDPMIYQGLDGVAMTSAAFERNVSWSPYLIAIAALLFAFSTMIAWAYYGLKGWTYLLGEAKLTEMAFKLIFCIFVVIGCSVELSAILDFSDAMVFLICVPNIIGLYLLAPIIKRELATYQATIDRK
ncbi:MAG: AGCS family alanine or glycine:cation symporter [Candidatus Azotimanducaceae bacterium]